MIVFKCSPTAKSSPPVIIGNDLLWFVALIVRYNDDGTLDPTFGDGGIIKYSYSDVDDEIYDMAIAPDGKIVVAGFSGSKTTIIIAY